LSSLLPRVAAFTSLFLNCYLILSFASNCVCLPSLAKSIFAPFSFFEETIFSIFQDYTAGPELGKEY
jgi:hypothetical protein